MARYLRQGYRRDRMGRTVSLSSSLDAFLERLDKREGLRLVKLWRAWDELLGDLAPMLKPLGHSGKTLLLYTEDEMFKQEAHFLVPMLLDKINSFFGEEVFDKVRFELLNGRAPLTDTKPEKSAAPRRILRKPRVLGTLTDKLDETTPVGRAYRAYLRVFASENKISAASGEEEKT